MLLRKYFPLKSILMLQMKIMVFILCLIFFNYKVSSSDCLVTATVTKSDCILYCWNTYNGTKDFYDFNTGNCQAKVTCGQGYYLDNQNNVCMDEYGGYILKQLGYVFKVKEQIMKFVQIIVLQGYTVGNTLFCNDGWKSSMKTQSKSNISIIIYVCDEQLKDGEIYPTTHGEYFFDRLTLEQQVYVMDTVLGTDNLSDFFTLKVIIFIILTILYVFLNIIACCKYCKKPSNLSCSCLSCCSKENQINDRLSESEINEVQAFLQKRKSQHLQRINNMKCFSLKNEINQQLQVLKTIKSQKQKIQKKKWWRRFKEKQEAKKQNKIQEVKQTSEK